MTGQAPSRIQEFINDDIFSFGQQARAHYKSDDLVVILDTTEEHPELSAFLRETMVNSEELTGNLRSKISKPASAARKEINSPHLSFWFIVIHENGMECASCNAAMLGPAGSA